MVAAAMTTVAEMAVTAATATSPGVQAVSERWQLQWWLQQLGQQRQQETAAATASVMAASDV